MILLFVTPSFKQFMLLSSDKQDDTNVKTIVQAGVGAMCFFSAYNIRDITELQHKALLHIVR